MIFEFYAIVAGVALIIVGPVLYIVVRRLFRQYKKEEAEDDATRELRLKAEREYEEWLGLQNEKPITTTEAETAVEQKSGEGH